MTRFENVPPQQSSQDQSSCSASDIMQLAISGITGLAVGAAMMYLFDPEVGADRRSRLSQTASGALESAGEYVHELKDRVMPSHSWSDVANDYRGRISSALGPYVGYKARRGYMSNLRNRASSTYRGASRTASRYIPRVHFGEERRGFSTTTASIGAFGALALGCAAMYFLDPRNGAARRAHMIQKAGRWIRDTGDLARATGRHLANRSRGLAHDARSMASGASEVDDRTLEQRIRSQLGHFGNVRELEVMVLNGCAVLRGQCGQSDIQKMVDAAGAVRGVRRVQCELRALDLSGSPTPGASQPYSSPNPTAM